VQVVTLTKHRGFASADDEQLHVLPLCVLDSTDEWGSALGQKEKVRSGAIECLNAFPQTARVRSTPFLCKRKRLLLMRGKSIVRGCGRGRGGRGRGGGRGGVSSAIGSLGFATGRLAMRRMPYVNGVRGGTTAGAHTLQRGQPITRRIVVGADGSKLRQRPDGQWVRVRIRGTKGSGRRGVGPMMNTDIVNEAVSRLGIPWSIEHGASTVEHCGLSGQSRMRMNTHMIGDNSSYHSEHIINIAGVQNVANHPNRLSGAQYNHSIEQFSELYPPIDLKTEIVTTSPRDINPQGGVDLPRFQSPVVAHKSLTQQSPEVSTCRGLTVQQQSPDKSVGKQLPGAGTLLSGFKNHSPSSGEPLGRNSFLSGLPPGLSTANVIGPIPHSVSKPSEPPTMVQASFNPRSFYKSQMLKSATHTKNIPLDPLACKNEGLPQDGHCPLTKDQGVVQSSLVRSVPTNSGDVLRYNTSTNIVEGVSLANKTDTVHGSVSMGTPDPVLRSELQGIMNQELKYVPNAPIRYCNSMNSTDPAMKPQGTSSNQGVLDSTSYPALSQQFIADQGAGQSKSCDLDYTTIRPGSTNLPPSSALTEREGCLSQSSSTPITKCSESLIVCGKVVNEYSSDPGECAYLHQAENKPHSALELLSATALSDTGYTLPKQLHSDDLLPAVQSFSCPEPRLNHNHNLGGYDKLQHRATVCPDRLPYSSAPHISSSSLQSNTNNIAPQRPDAGKSMATVDEQTPIIEVRSLCVYIFILEYNIEFVQHS